MASTYPKQCQCENAGTCRRCRALAHKREYSRQYWKRSAVPPDELERRINAYWDSVVDPEYYRTSLRRACPLG